MGLGESLQKAFYLPEAHTDMIAAVIGEELGLVGIAMIVGLFSLFGYAGLQTAKKASDPYAKLLAAGLTSLVVVQAAINLFAVLGLAPLTGVPLPFVSYGNSSLLTMLAAVGVLLNIARTPGARLRVVSGDRMQPRVVVAAGGTAGHVVPALAVADALRDRGALVSFAGTAERAEATLVPEAGYEIDHLRVRGIDRSKPGPRRGSRVAGGASGACRQEDPQGAKADAVLGGGGYVAAPVGIARQAPWPAAGRDRGRPPPWARQPPARAPGAPGLPGFRDPGSGRRPLPRDRQAGAARRDPRPTASPLASGSAWPADARVLLVFGGSQGALSINTAVLEGLLDPDPGFHVLHVTGTRDHEMVASRVAEAGAEKRFTVLEYVKDLGDPLAACDLVLARSGASVFELAAAGRPAILVPYPYATGRHQHLNAEWMASAGAALVVEDSELDGAKVRELAGEMLGDAARLREMAEASASLAMPDAAERIASRGPVCDWRRRMTPKSWEGRKLHFIAIGGAGMSGLALVAHRLGASVTGSDRADSTYMDRLREAGLDPRRRP